MPDVEEFPQKDAPEQAATSPEPRKGPLAKVDMFLRGLGVEYDLILPKAAYLTMIGSYGAIIPFIPIYLRHVGLPVEQIGLLQTIRPVASFISSPIWAAIGDKFGVYKLLLIVALILSTLLRLSMIWISSFFAFAALFAVMEFIGTPTGPLLDATTMKILGESRRQHYGKQRLWGAVGFGLTALLVGSLVTKMHNPYIYFPIHAVIMSFSLFSIAKMTVAAPKLSSGFWSNLKHVAESPRIAVFFFTVFAMGVAGGVLGSYVSLHIQTLFVDPDEANALLGFMQIIACTSEVVFFANSATILEKVGPKYMIALGALGFAMRFAYYALVTSPWYVLPNEILHGVSWATFWAASQQYAVSVAPQGMEGTLQGLMTGFYSGLGAGSGNLMGGFINKHFGSHALFWGTSAWLLLVLVIFIGANWLIDKKEGGMTKPPPPGSGSPHPYRTLQKDTPTEISPASSESSSSSSTPHERESPSVRSSKRTVRDADVELSSIGLDAHDDEIL